MRNIKLAAMASLVLSGCSAPFAPGTKVKPAKSQDFLACASQERLNKAIELSVAQSISGSRADQATLNAMLTDGTCTKAPGNKVYSITAVDGDEVEFVTADAPKTKGMWAGATSFDPAK